MINFWFAFKSIFRTNNAGQKLFYPNGIFATGYVIPSEAVYKRLTGGYIFIMIAGVLLLLLAVAAIFLFRINLYVAIIIPVIIYMVAYFVWVQIQTRYLVKVKM